MARRGQSDETELCECCHSKHSHERNRATLAWDGPCRALNVTELSSGERDVKPCGCARFTPVKTPDESGPCRRCGKVKINHRGTIGHSYEAK